MDAQTPDTGLRNLALSARRAHSHGFSYCERLGLNKYANVNRKDA